ncbi:MAG TPA: ABC transporter ATP-binding protein [Victivallales bacterium]|nr:ABC transporter ATP-binding protein [Victivallales bacterium]
MKKNKSKYAIDVKEVTKSFGSNVVVDKVEMQVKYGGIYGFLGPNGSGKTTFLRMLCGLLNPDAGVGTCLDFDIITEQALIKQEIGYMTQKFSLYEDLTIKENLEFVASLYQIKNKKKTVDRVLEENNLTNRYKQLAGKLSGGWKQRLALAACLLHEPKLLLLDEPTAGVDPLARRDFWDTIHHLSGEKGITVLVTTHYMDEAERCHRLAYLAYGKLLTRGTIDDIISGEDLSTWVVKGRNLLALSMELNENPAIDQVLAFGNTLHVSGKNAKALENVIKPFRTNEYSWEKAETSIEDVFIHLMKKSKDNF